MSPVTLRDPVPTPLSPFQKLLKSRKFLIAVLDVVVSSVLYFGVKYAAPSAAEDIKFLIGVIQLPAVMLIYGIAYEDGQEKRSGTFIPDPPEAVG